jgi:hypothetical protein
MNRWIDASRNHQYFASKNSECLEQELNLRINPIAKPNEQMPHTSSKSGRRKLEFEKSSKRIRRRKLKDIRKTVGFHELTNATNLSLRYGGKTDAAKLCSGALETVLTRA